MHDSRRAFLRTLGLTALGAALAPAWAAEETTPATIDGLEVRKALPVIEPTYEVDALAINKGPGFGRRLAMTFDDGPAPTTTHMVLEQLRQRKIKATFFMIGQRVKEYPDIARDVLSEGHEIGNHSFTHPALGKMAVEKVTQEIQGCQDIIGQTLNLSPVWFRPPYGSFRKELGPLAVARQLGVAYWSVDPQDWRKPGSSVVAERVLSQSRPGSIVLLHDIHRPTAEAVPAILDGLLERGYEFTTLSGFLGHPYLPS